MTYKGIRIALYIDRSVTGKRKIRARGIRSGNVIAQGTLPHVIRKARLVGLLEARQYDRVAIVAR